MIQTPYYTYLGTNGTITSPVFLEGVYCIVKYWLTAEEGQLLTDGKQYVKTILVPEKDISTWIEVEDKGQALL